MLADTYSTIVATGLNLAAASVSHYRHLGPAASVRTIGIVLTGATINSVAPVAVDFAIVGGAAIGSVTLANGTTAGQGASVTINPAVALPTNAVISVTVSAAASVAAGTGTLSIQVING